MDITIVKEEHHYENRVALNPTGALALVRHGHNVFVESGAGMGAGFTDEQYSDVGAKVVYSKDEAFMRGEMLLKIFPPTLEEYALMPDEQIIFSSLHLVAAGKEGLQMIIDKKLTGLGLEVIRDQKGSLPLLSPMSELAGQMALPIASYYLSNVGGGRGVLLGGASGIPPATVTILGAGMVGFNAARTALGMGAHVILFDAKVERLRRANDAFNKQLVTFLPYRYNLDKVIPISDVVIGAALVYGEETPKLIPEYMVEKMKPGSLIIDVSIDQGGCVETSRPTNWHTPSFVKHGVTHFCVPNMPSNVGRTATYALSNALIPYVLSIAENGLESALKADSGLIRGVYAHKGFITNSGVAKKYEIDYVTIEDAMGGTKA
jgi:alanine dehydrogenase